MQKKREKLIELLISYYKEKGHEVTLVFDGWKGGHGKETRTVTGGIVVIYSGLGERADNVIKRIISKRQRKWTVVSSDREIEQAAWKESCVPVKSEIFYDVMLKALHENEAAKRQNTELWDKGDEECDRPVKGNPRKLSKKRKEIQKVLEKLKKSDI